MDPQNKRLAALWLIISALNTVRYAIVAIMAETMTLLAHVPINKQEEFLARVNELVFETIEDAVS